MVDLYSSFSALRWSVAWMTDLSKALMPAVKAAISSVVVSMKAFVSSMAFSKSEMSRSSSFFLSSAASISFSQYSFLSSSSTCSLPSSVTISSIIVNTLSKLTFLPRRAKEIKSKRLSWLPRSAFMAKWRTSLSRWDTCKSEGLGRVFPKRSSASSSFRILMVSASAKVSSARVFFTTSYSASLDAQLLSKSDKNFLSSS
mmetsp:Transcript_80044/g.203690  ORF Transcript_80044/g.203690 Transcript_80044/m.203690 type:complete len:200 (-) Transcript_80044:371-970(-)